MLGTILLIILIIALLGGIRDWGRGPFYGTGYYGGGGLGLVLVIVLIQVLTGRVDQAWGTCLSAAGLAAKRCSKRKEQPWQPAPYIPTIS
jgi:uncharacterized membrane protein YedE/YeeE